MSTTARKARKRNRHDAINWHAVAGIEHHLVIPEPFQHSAKVGTPIAERAENQPRDVFGKGPRNPATRHGLTHGARRRLTAAGLVIDGDTVKQPGWFRRLFCTGSAAA